MKILFVASIYRHITTFHIPFLVFFQQRGYEVWVAASGEKSEKEKLENMGVKCIDVDFTRSPFSFSNMGAYLQLKKIAKTQDFDLIHVHTPVASFLTRIAFKNARKGIVLYTAHGFHFYDGAPLINWLLYFNVEKIIRRYTDGIIVMNEEDQRNAIKLGYEKEKIFFVHGVGVKIAENKVDSIKLDRLRNELGLKPKDIVVSFVAELNDNKNHQFLLRNWNDISRRCPNAVLFIIGDGHKAKELQDYVEKQRMSNVRFLGFREDIPNLLKLTDIITLLSKREGLPRSIMEAMSQKIPCIVTNIRGLRDLTQDKKNGYVINLGEDIELQNAFISLLEDKILRKQMGECSFDLVQPYSIDKVLLEYEKVYKQFINIDSNNC
jgi:glycosyltransferase involved in cell wall biosynthesis